MNRRLFWGPWMFSPATVMCILGFAGCVCAQVAQQNGGLSFLGGIEGLVLIYVAFLEVAFLVAALVCSVISIERLPLGLSPAGYIGHSFDRPMQRDRAAFPVDQAPPPEQVEKTVSPRPEAQGRPSGTIIYLGDFRKRRNGDGAD